METVAASKFFPVTEIFGPVIQGEGMLVGRPTIFVRMAGCDYRCSWCDTPESVLPEIIKNNHARMAVSDILLKINQLGAKYVGLKKHSPIITISGGNPAIHNLYDLVAQLRYNRYSTAVETQGSIWNDWLWMVHHLTISPKPPSSGNDTCDDIENFMMKWQFNEQLSSTQEVCFKIVIFDEIDFKYARDVRNQWPEITMYLQPGTAQVNATTHDPTMGCDAHRAGLIQLRAQSETNEDIAEVRRDILERTLKVNQWVLDDPYMSQVRVIPQLPALTYGHRRGI